MQPPPQPQTPHPIPIPILNPLASSPTRWQTLIRRTPTSHNSFLYGVKTTHIYCRPTCTARLARRANILYFDTIAQARNAGYRACQRCKPDDEKFVGEGQEIVERTIGILRGRGKGGLRLEGVAREAGVTKSYLCRVFRRRMGVTVREYVEGFERGGSGVGPGKADMDVEIDVVMPVQAVRFGEEAFVEGINIEGGPAEKEVRNAEDVLDLDFDLDLDFEEWFEKEYSLSDSVYG